MTAAEKLSLTIRDEEFVVLVGPSGCGKSTKMRMVSGLETVASETVHAGDLAISDVLPRDYGVSRGRVVVQTFSSRERKA